MILKEKKKRYILHNNIENYYHSVGNNIETNKNEMSLSHGNPLDLNYKAKRGYDILTGNNLFEQDNNLKNKNDVNKSQKKSGQYFDNWEKIKLKSDENNTILKKPVYKGPYDSSDVEKNYEKYIKNRRIRLMNNNINKSYDNFNRGFFEDLNKNYNIKKKNFPIANYINRTNDGNFRNSNNSGIMNDMKNRIDTKIKYDEMDKEKFFGYSFLTKNKNSS